MRIGKANGEDWLRLSEAARALGVSLNTVRRWSDSGQLVGYRSPGGHRRFRRADVDTFIHGAAAEHPDAARSRFAEDLGIPGCGRLGGIKVTDLLGRTADGLANALRPFHDEEAGTQACRTPGQCPD